MTLPLSRRPNAKRNWNFFSAFCNFRPP